MKYILVTGGAGYIGSHCCKILSRAGWTPVVIDNLSYGHESMVKWGPFFNVGLHDTNEVSSIIHQFNIQYVMHFAAYAYVGESVLDPLKYYQNNVGGTVSLLEAMKRNDVKNIVFSSTCATYGNPEYTPIDEIHPQKPINPYGKTKLVIEEILSDMKCAGELNYVALRYFNAAGCDPDMEIGEWHEPETHLVPLALQAILSGKPLTIFGDDYATEDGTCIRDYIHVNDISRAHLLAVGLLEKGRGSHAINLGTGIGFSVKDILDACFKVTGQKVPMIMGARRAGDPANLVASYAKAQKILGWNPEYTNLEKTIETAWKWINNKENFIEK